MLYFPLPNALGLMSFELIFDKNKKMIKIDNHYYSRHYRGCVPFDLFLCNLQKFKNEIGWLIDILAIIMFYVLNIYIYIKLVHRLISSCFVTDFFILVSLFSCRSADARTPVVPWSGATAGRGCPGGPPAPLFVHRPLSGHPWGPVQRGSRCPARYLCFDIIDTVAYRGVTGYRG